MNVESGFLGKDGAWPKGGSRPDGEAWPDGGAGDGVFSGVQVLSVSERGFFRVLVGRHLGRKVVVKTLKEEWRGNAVAEAQLRKEFEVVFPLTSANVVHALNWTEVDGGLPALEMEWCEGRDVRGLISEGLTGDDVRVIVRGVLRGLADVHRAGVVHRDVKPENVVYDRFRKVVKVIDFGCAYLTGSLVLQGPNGTDGYTPLQKLEAGSEPEPKDDLYALGVMVGEMADALMVEGRADGGLRRGLRGFSARLMKGRFDSADEAERDFERVVRGRAGWSMAAAAAVVVAVCVAVGWWLFGREGDAQGSEVEARMEGVRVDSVEAMPRVEERVEGVVAAAPEVAAVVADKELARTEDEKAKGKAETEDDDAAVFELGIYAGQLLRRAQMEGASEATLMDAFVVNFCDSVYRAEGLNSRLPRAIDEAERRDVAKRLAAEYGQEMERRFRARFGGGGSEHRRMVLLEGRFYCSLMVYHGYAGN